MSVKRENMYRDAPDVPGGAIHVGYVYGYKSPPATYDDKHGWCRDWVEITTETISPIAL